MTRMPSDINVHVYLHSSPADERKLELIFDALDLIKKDVKKMANEMRDLTLQVTETKGAMQSALVLIRGIAEALRRAGTDPVRLDALRTSLKTDEDALAEAIAENPVPVNHPGWTPDTAYVVGANVADPNGWETFTCATDHTSGTGTMAEDRAAHTEYWTAADNTSRSGEISPRFAANTPRSAENKSRSGEISPRMSGETSAAFHARQSRVDGNVNKPPRKA